MDGHNASFDAIVLDCRDYGEADLIVSCFHQQRGKITAIAKNAKKSKRRFVNKLELFSFLRVSLRSQHRTTLPILEEAELYSSFLLLRQRLELYSAASLIREFLLAVLREGDGDQRLFKLTLWALHSLNEQQPLLAIIAQFLIRYFDCIGYRPELAHCQLCRCPAGPARQQAFSISHGGILCPACAASCHQVLLPVQAGTLRFLQSSQDSALDRLTRLKISPALLAEGLQVLRRYGNSILQRDIICWKALPMPRPPSELPSYSR